MNRCEVRVLQRKDLERTSKEQPYSLRTVGYGWVRICGVCGGKGLLWIAIRKGFGKRKAFGVRKRAAFLAQARQHKNEKPFINPLRQHFSTVPKLTCSNPFRISLATVSLQQNNPFSKLRSLALAVQLPFRTDSNPHRRYPERLQFPIWPVT